MKKLIIILLCGLCVPIALSDSFWKKLGNEAKKAAKEVVNESVNSLTDKSKNEAKKEEPTPNATKPSTQSKVATTPEKKLGITVNNPSFYTPHLTPNTRFLKVPKSSSVSDINDGMFSVKNHDNNLIAFFDKDGNCVFDYEWTPTSTYFTPEFDNGACLVRGIVKKGENYPLTILYKDGRAKELKTIYKIGTQFRDGVALVSKDMGGASSQWIYIDMNGNEVYPALASPAKYYSTFDTKETQPLREGLRAYYSYANKLWGYINSKGVIVIKPQFEKARPFNEGIAAVEIKENYTSKWGFIDKTGKFVITPQFTGEDKYLSDCHDGIIMHKSMEDYSYYDKKGTKLASYKEAVSPFYGGYAFITKKTQGGDDYIMVINTKLQELYPTSYFEVDYGYELLDMGKAGIATVASTDKFVITPNGQVIIRAWNKKENRSTSESIEKFSKDQLAKAATRHNGVWYYGFINTQGEFTLVYSSDDLTNTPIAHDPSKDNSYKNKDGHDTPNPETFVLVQIPPRDKKTIITEPTYTVKTIASPEDGGTISGAGTYKFGQTAKISAIANKGYKLIGISSSNPSVKIEDASGEALINAQDLIFTANFIKRDTITDIDKSGAFLGKVFGGEDKAVPVTVYMELSKEKNSDTPYGKNTSGFLTAIFNSSTPYTMAMDGDFKNGSATAKFCFLPMRIAGYMTEGTKKYIVADGGQLLIGGLNLDVKNPLMSLYFNMIININGNSFATVSSGRYRVELLNYNESTGETTLGYVQRFSPSYGWVDPNDKRITSSKKGFLCTMSTDNGIPADIFNGCKLSPSEKRNDISWTPPVDWFKSESIFQTTCNEILKAMGALKTDAEEFWEK